LDVDIRKGIWNTFLKNAITAKGKADYSDKVLNNLARHDLNGHQVGTCFIEIMNSYTDKFFLQFKNVVQGSVGLGIRGRDYDVIFSFRNRN
jgi:hypothetical protein